MKKLPALKLFIIPVIFLLIITGCNKNSTTSTLPLLYTSQISSIDSSTAVSGGNIFSDGGEPIIARGICWSILSQPTIFDSKTIEGQGTGSFSSSITGLIKGTLYNVRAYATNISGTAYGQVMSFYTLGALPVNPLISAVTEQAAKITSTTATLYGRVDSTYLISDVSFEYGLTTNYGMSVPVVLKSARIVQTGNSTKSLPVLVLVGADISGLIPNTTYHYRVRVNTLYAPIVGADMSFMTTY